MWLSLLFVKMQNFIIKYYEEVVNEKFIQMGLGLVHKAERWPVGLGIIKRYQYGIEFKFF